MAAAEKFAGAVAVELIDAVRIARSAGGLLIEHAALTAELARSDWEQEQARLKRLLFTTLLYAILVALALLHVSVVALAAAWDTPYRVHSAIAMLVLWLVGAVLVRRRLQRISAEGEGRFAASRAEFGKTMDLLRSHL